MNLVSDKRRIACQSRIDRSQRRPHRGDQSFFVLRGGLECCRKWGTSFCYSCEDRPVEGSVDPQNGRTAVLVSARLERRWVGLRWRSLRWVLLPLLHDQVAGIAAQGGGELLKIRKVDRLGLSALKSRDRGLRNPRTPCKLGLAPSLHVSQLLESQFHWCHDSTYT